MRRSLLRGLTMMQHAKTMVIGCDSLIGRAFYNVYSGANSNLFATSRRINSAFSYFDLQEPIDLRHFPGEGYSWAVIAAALPSILLCEKEKELSYRVNVSGTLALATRLAERGIRPIVFSTDYVFDGVKGAYVEDDPVNPLNEYGRQKAELEQRIASVTGGNYLLIRLSKVLTDQLNDGSMIAEMVSKLLRGERIYAAVDQVFSPIFLSDVLQSVVLLQKCRAKGLFNVSGSEVWSRFDLAAAVARSISADESLVNRIRLKDLNEPFERPLKTDMKSEKIKSIQLLPIRKISDFINKLPFHNEIHSAGVHGSKNRR